MHVLVLTTSYPRREDDWAGHFVRGFARYLAGAGHDVSVVAAGEGARREAEEQGLRVVRIRSRGLFFRGGAPEALASPASWAAVPLFVAQMAAEAMRAARPDAVVSHWLVPSGLLGCALARGRPHLAIAHSGDVALLQRMPGGATAARAFSATGARPVFVSADLRERFLALCDEDARRILAQRSLVCPMGIDVAALRRPPARRAAHGRLRVLFLGRLVALKGVRVAARAARLTPGVELHVAGDGPEKAHLSGAVLHGEVAFARKRELLHAADVLVLPSLPRDGRTEGAPTVLLEAMAAGLPIVASRTGGVEEIVRDGETGLLVPPGDEDALAAAFARLRDDVRLRARLGKRAAAEAARFDWSAVGARLLAALVA